MIEYTVKVHDNGDIYWFINGKKHREDEQQSQMKASRKKNFKNPGKETSINIDLRKEE